MEHNNRPRTFALDFDDTFTADPELWAVFVTLGISRRHTFYCVTARRDTEENTDLINDLFEDHGIQMPIIFSNLGSKLEEVERRGIKIDIWIDDAPYAIVHGL
jgi:hypothetical protein